MELKHVKNSKFTFGILHFISKQTVIPLVFCLFKNFKFYIILVLTFITGMAFINFFTEKQQAMKRHDGRAIMYGDCQWFTGLFILCRTVVVGYVVHISGLSHGMMENRD